MWRKRSGSAPLKYEPSSDRESSWPLDSSEAKKDDPSASVEARVSRRLSSIRRVIRHWASHGVADQAASFNRIDDVAEAIFRGFSDVEQVAHQYIYNRAACGLPQRNRKSITYISASALPPYMANLTHFVRKSSGRLLLSQMSNLLQGERPRLGQSFGHPWQSQIFHFHGQPKDVIQAIIQSADFRYLSQMILPFCLRLCFVDVITPNISTSIRACIHCKNYTNLQAVSSYKDCIRIWILVHCPL